MIVSSSIVKAIVDNRAVIVDRDYKGGSKSRFFVEAIFEVIGFLFFIKVVLVGFAFNLIISPLYFLTYFLILLSCVSSSLILS